MEDLSFQSWKSNSITQDNILSPSDLKIKSICAFVDGRAHASFNDSSALILHQGHECLTYFSKSGKKLRFLVKSIPRTEMVEDKVCLLLKNINEHNDIPSIHSETLYAGEEQAESSEKITSCIWSLEEECNNNFEVDDEGGVSILSMEGHAKLTLLKNKFIVQVEYLQLLPKKKAVLNEERSYEEQSQLGNSKEFDFKTDFMQKYNLNQQSYKGNSIKDSKRTTSSASSSVKLVHQYTKIIKLFSIFVLPDRWILPFFLIWRRLRQQRFITAFGREIHPEHEPIFQEDILEFIQLIQQKSEQSLSYANELAFKNHIREKYSLSQINQNEVTTELPQVNINSNTSQSSINSENLWKCDEAMPPFDLPKYPERILFAQKGNSISWINTQGEVLVFEKDTSEFIFSTLEGKFFHEVKENDTTSIKESEKVYNILHVWKDDAKTRLLCELAALREHDVLIAQKNQVVNEKSNKQFISEEDVTNIDIDNYEVVNSSQNDIGSFEAFKNGCIKILFRDRTILRWMKGQQQVHIISRFGDSISVLIDAPHEFQEYVTKAIEFRDYCFGDPKEQFEKQRQKQELSQMIDFEISKNQRFLTILSGKAPQMVEQPVGYSPEYSLVESYTSECGQVNNGVDLDENNLNFQVEEDQQPYLSLNNHIPQQNVGYEQIQNELTILSNKKQTLSPIEIKNNERRRFLESDKMDKYHQTTSSDCFTGNQKQHPKHQSSRKGSYFDISASPQVVQSNKSLLSMIKENTERYTNGFYKNLSRTNKDNKSQSLSLASSPGVTSAQKSVCSTQTNFEWMHFEKQDQIQQGVNSTSSIRKPAEIEKKQLIQDILEEDKRNRIKQEQMNKEYEQKKVAKVFSNRSLSKHHFNNSFHDYQFANQSGRYNFKTSSKSSHQVFNEALQRRLSINQQNVANQTQNIFNQGSFYSNKQFPVFPQGQGISLNNNIRSQGMLVNLVKEQEKIKKINNKNSLGLENIAQKQQHDSSCEQVINNDQFKNQRQISSQYSACFRSKINGNFSQSMNKQPQIMNLQSKIRSEKQKGQQEFVDMTEFAMNLQGNENSKEQEYQKE